MQGREHSASRLVAVALTVVALLQGFCVMGLFALPAPAGILSTHAGCHGSSTDTPAPKAPASPMPHQSCCSASLTPQPSSLAGCFAPTWTTAEWVGHSDFSTVDWLHTVSSQSSHLNAPPGFHILRI